MQTTNSEQRVLASFTSEQWDGRPGKSGFTMFFGGMLIGYVVALILMTFISPLRSGSAATVLALIIGVAITWMGIAGNASTQKAFARNLLETINDTVLGITGNPNDRLTAAHLRSFTEGEKSRPLLVNGIPGIQLRAVRSRTMAPQRPVRLQGSPIQNQPAPIVTTIILLDMTAPDLSVDSFDRLLNATG